MSIAEWGAVSRELRTSSWLHLSGNVHVAGSAADAESLLQKQTDDAIAEIDSLLKGKEEEILEV